MWQRIHDGKLSSHASLPRQRDIADDVARVDRETTDAQLQSKHTAQARQLEAMQREHADHLARFQQEHMEQAERLARFQREMHEQHQQQEALHRTAMLAGIATEDCQQCDHTQSTACFSSEV